MPFTGNPSTSAIDRVRLMTGDILPEIEFLNDETYQFALNESKGSEKQAALRAARYILGSLTPMARERAGDIEYYGAEFFRNYRDFLLLLIQNPHAGFIDAMPFAGGISRAEIERERNNPDSFRPVFWDRVPEEISTCFDGWVNSQPNAYDQPQLNNVVVHKRGDSFILPVKQVDDQGEVLQLDGAVISAQIRTANDQLVSELIFTPNSPGVFDGVLNPTNPNTSGWPLGDLYCDIQVVQSGITTSSQTFTIRVVVDITHG